MCLAAGVLPFTLVHEYNVALRKSQVIRYGFLPPFPNREQEPTSPSQDSPLNTPPRPSVEDVTMAEAQSSKKTITRIGPPVHARRLNIAIDKASKGEHTNQIVANQYKISPIGSNKLH